MRATFASGLLAILATLSSGASADDTKVTCAHGAESGERLRDDGKPLAARARFLACARPTCPAIVRSHCARWLEQIELAIPTIVVKARAGSAEHPADVTDVRVAVDGAPVLEVLDGQPLRLEPGAHTLKLTRAGDSPIEARVLLVAGEKNRQVTAEFPGKRSPVVPPAPAAPVAPPPAVRPEPVPPEAPTARGVAASSSATRATSIRPAAWAFAGLALAAGGSFGYFGVTGKSELDSFRTTCAGHCEQSAVSAAWNKLIVADVSLAVSVVSAGLATWLFVSPRHADAEPREGAASWLLVSPSARGFQLGWQGAF